MVWDCDESELTLSPGPPPPFSSLPSPGWPTGIVSLQFPSYLRLSVPILKLAVVLP